MAHRCLTALACTLTVVAIAALPTGAHAAPARSQSTNWAGYAVSGRGVQFRTAFGTWVQPAAPCSNGTPSNVAVWVGIGGYPSSARALDQIGTELDCSTGGRARYSAWYELVPAGSVSIPLKVRPGDRMAASVSVTGRRVRMRLHNLTTNATFTKVRRASRVDLKSAEWIVEAPTLCDADNNCNVSPLADFGTTSFSTSRAATTTGHTGAIADPSWSATALDLVPGGPDLGKAPVLALPGLGSATTGDLAPSGDAFTVTYQSPTAPGSGLPAGTPPWLNSRQLGGLVVTGHPGP